MNTEKYRELQEVIGEIVSIVISSGTMNSLQEKNFLKGVSEVEYALGRVAFAHGAIDVREAMLD